tara:strand:+ start:9595 stop:9879 length:285 start_codon:yes stop_codon:yes gene_type:complete
MKTFKQHIKENVGVGDVYAVITNYSNLPGGIWIVTNNGMFAPTYAKRRNGGWIRSSFADNPNNWVRLSSFSGDIGENKLMTKQEFEEWFTIENI